MLEISELCSVWSFEDYFDSSCFFIVENPLLMKHFWESGINAVINHSAVGQRWAGQRAKIFKCTKLLPRTLKIQRVSENI